MFGKQKTSSCSNKERLSERANVGVYLHMFTSITALRILYHNTQQ